MTFLDVKTVVAMQSIIALTCTTIVAILWQKNKKYFKGIGFWLIHFITQTIAGVLILLRGIVSDFVSIVLANFLIILGMIFFYIGTNVFLNYKEKKYYASYIFLGLFTFVHFYFCFIEPNLNARNLNVSIGMSIISIQIIWFILKNKEKILYPIFFTYTFYLLVNIIRMGFILFYEPEATDFFKNNPIDTLFLSFYSIVLVLLTHSVFLIINEKLLKEITGKEERFSKAFHSSPYATALTKIESGEIIDINESFVKLFGYERDELIGKTTIELQIWIKPEQRKEMIEKLKKGEDINNINYKFLKKGGETIDVLYSAEMFKIESEDIILSSINDITNLKYTEEQLKKKIGELEKMNKFMVGRELKMSELKKELEVCRNIKK